MLDTAVLVLNDNQKNISTHLRLRSVILFEERNEDLIKKWSKTVRLEEPRSMSILNKQRGSEDTVSNY